MFRLVSFVNIPQIGHGREEKGWNKCSLLLNYQPEIHSFPKKMLFLRWLGNFEQEVCSKEDGKEILRCNNSIVGM